jgi:SAM-dependent methyltransferase
MARIAAEIPAGANVLDVGAGEAPYRELFSHTRYLTCDWEDSQYPEAAHADIRAPATSIPVEDGTFDVVLNTQVLEHLSEPARAMASFHRVLGTNGRLYLTAPMVWYLHEEPYDYYRYTAHGLRYLLENSGFVDIDIRPMTDVFATLAQLTAHVGYMMGRTPDGFDMQRDIVAKTMSSVSSLIASFESMDTQWILPLSYSAVATRSDTWVAQTPSGVVSSEVEALRMQTVALQRQIDAYRQTATAHGGRGGGAVARDALDQGLRLLRRLRSARDGSEK